MHDRSLVLERIAQVEEAVRQIERRFEGIAAAQDFVADDAGLDRMDAIAMMRRSPAARARPIHRRSTKLAP